MKNVLKNKKALIIAGGVVGVLVLGGGGVAVASTLGDDRVSGSAADRAQEAALAETGGGTVTEIDRLDDGLPGYEVEVVLPDGREGTVMLGDDFGVTSSRVDDDRDDSSGRDGRDDDDDRDDDGRDDDDLSDDSTATPGAGALTGTSDDDDDLVGADYDQAAAAAIAAAGGGTVTDADRSDYGDVAYEVDVRLDDGTEVDVDLDASFGVLRTDVDDRR